MGVFWNLGWMELQVYSIYCVYLNYAYDMMRCLYNRFRFPAVPVTKVRQRLPKFEGQRDSSTRPAVQIGVIVWKKLHTGEQIASAGGCDSLKTAVRNVYC